MQAYVFTDKALARYAGQFVWLSIDGEKASNASLRKKFQLEGYPSFYIVDPKNEHVLIRWLGGATVPQISRLLDDGLRSTRKTDDKTQKLLAQADALYGEGNVKDAAAAYEKVLASAPPGWSRRPRVTESWLFSLQSSGATEQCASVARKAFGPLRHSSSSANVAAIGLDCALNLPADHPFRSEWVTELERDVNVVLDDPSISLAADDRSGLYQSAIDAREQASDKARARKLTEDWSAFLDREAAKAKTPEGRAVFDSHRLGAYLALGQPERALPMLEQSARDFPDDYNPHARMASALKALKRYDEALAETTKALEHAYGPRRLLILSTRVDIQREMGRTEDAKATLRQAITEAEAMPEEERSPRTIAGFKKKLDDMSKVN